MSRLLLAVLLSLGLTTCTAPAHFQQAPRASRRFVHHRQRVHEHERRHQRPALSWGKW